MLLKLVLPLLILAGTLPIARADDASKLAKVHEIFQITNIREISESRAKLVKAEAISEVSKMVPENNLTAEERLQIKNLDRRIIELLSSALSWNQIEPQIAKSYTDAFTEQQLDDIIAFYKSPTGRAVIAKMPILQKQLMELMHQQVVGVMPKIRQSFEDFDKQISTQKQTTSPNTTDQK